MSFDLFVGILSLTIAAGQVYAATKKERPKVILFATAGACVVLLLWGGWNVFVSIKHQTDVRQRASKIYSALDKPKTFDDIMNSLNFMAFDDVNEGIDFLYDAGDVKPQVLTLRGPDGREYAVRTFVRTR